VHSITAVFACGRDGSSIAAVVAGEAIAFAGAEFTAPEQCLMLASTCFMRQSCSKTNTAVFTACLGSATYHDEFMSTSIPPKLY
jgi:hypothetical protein